LTLPYVIAAAGRARGELPQAWFSTGLAAGVGFSLKPYFVITFVILEFWLLVSRRPIWRGAWLAGGVIGAYGLSVLLFIPEYLEMVIEQGSAYASFARPGARPSLTLLPITSCLACILVRGVGRELRLAVACATSGWLLGYIAQTYTVGYRLLPALSGAGLLLMLALIAVDSQQRRIRYSLVGPAILILIFVVAFSLESAQRERSWRFIDAVASVIDGERAFVLSTGPGDGFPVFTYSTAEWALPANGVWPILAIHTDTIDYGPPLPVEEFMIRYVVRALETWSTVLVARRDGYEPLAVLERHAAFRAAWFGYTQADSVAGFRVYRRELD
jgi:hypothetical protein